MKLSENPIFLTHKRLIHRGGVLAAILIAALTGFSLLAGMVSCLSVPRYLNVFYSPQVAGKTFYGLTIGVEILVLIFGGFVRISHALAEDRKAGLWDSNRLTPLKPAQIIAGYWFGPALREFYMAVTLAGIGLIIVIAGRLPITFWLGTQTLIASTALLFGLIGILVGMALQRSQGVVIFLLLLVMWPFCFVAPARMLSNFLLPVYSIAHFFQSEQADEEWSRLPELFGGSIYPVLLTLGLQLVIGFFIWRALARKTANPFQPLLLRWEAVVLSAIFIITQHALLWDLWSGQFPTIGSPEFNSEGLLAIVHGGTIVVGILLLFLTSPSPERVRVDSLRHGFKNLGAVFSRSAVSVALVLSAIAGAAMLTQFLFSLMTNYRIFLVSIANLTEIFLVFSLLLEFCRLHHKRRVIGFFALWLFILCVIPFILAGVFLSEIPANLSLLSPGFIALADRSHPDWKLLFFTVLAHFGIIIVLFIGWRREWIKLLQKAS